jgi:hypothetical protein
MEYSQSAQRGCVYVQVAGEGNFDIYLGLHLDDRAAVSDWIPLSSSCTEPHSVAS